MGCEVIPISLKETLDFSELSQAIQDFNPAWPIASALFCTC
jgi:hypothetical protein